MERNLAVTDLGHGNHFIAHEVQTTVAGRIAIKKKRSNSLSNISPQFVPGVGLREDVLGQTFGAIASVALLNDLTYQLVHHSP